MSGLLRGMRTGDAFHRLPFTRDHLRRGGRDQRCRELSCAFGSGRHGDLHTGFGFELPAGRYDGHLHGE